MKLKIKRGDVVEVISGSEKGKKGSVLAVDPKDLRIKVEGIKLMTHFDKKKGKITLEGFMPYSKVKLVEVASSGAKNKKTVKKASAV